MNRYKSTSVWFNSLANLLFPNTCLYCGEPVWEQKPVLCPNCEGSLDKIPEPYFQIYREKIEPCYIDRVLIAFVYGPILQELMEKLKYNGEKEIGRNLGLLAKKTLNHFLPEESTIVPIPLHPKKAKLRGYNQAQLIAEGFSATGLDVRTDLLMRDKETTTQTRLNKDERKENVSGAFEILDNTHNPEMKKRNIILIDDVMTSGATINEAAHTLKKNGFENVCAVGVASPLVSDFY